MNLSSKLHTPRARSVHSASQVSAGLRRTMSGRFMRLFGVQLPPALIHRILDEAAGSARESGFPDLFFPALAEEKARLAFAAVHPAIGVCRVRSSGQSLAA